MQTTIHTPGAGLHSARIDGEVLRSSDSERREGDDESVVAHRDGEWKNGCSGWMESTKCS
jgi:hypothetical protein